MLLHSVGLVLRAHLTLRTLFLASPVHVNAVIAVVDLANLVGGICPGVSTRSRARPARDRVVTRVAYGDPVRAGNRQMPGLLRAVLRVHIAVAGTGVRASAIRSNRVGSNRPACLRSTCTTSHHTSLMSPVLVSEVRQVLLPVIPSVVDLEFLTPDRIHVVVDRLRPLCHRVHHAVRSGAEWPNRHHGVRVGRTVRVGAEATPAGVSLLQVGSPIYLDA